MALYAQRLPDLIVSIGASAAHFVQQHRADLFPTTPMLLAAVELRRVEPSLLSERDAVAGVRYDQVAAIENILRLLPETKAIAIIIGNSPNERFWVEEQQRILGPLLENKVELIFYNERPFGEILKEVASLPPHSAIFYQQLWVDGAGAVYGDKEPLKRIYEVANAPIFSFDESLLNGEIVGGPMFSPAEAARPTAAVAVRMLGGETGGIKVPPIEFSAPKYDWRQLQRWNISESRLPPGSEVLFREPTAWERYTWQISATAAALLLQAVMIIGLFYEHRRRRNAEIEARQRMFELAHMNRHATAGELSASIAHELNQPLGAILNNTETATIILNSPSPNLDEIKTIVDEIRRDDQRASEVILRLRRLLKKSASETENIDLNEKVRQVFRLISVQAAERNVTLNSSLAQGPLRMSGDRIQLQQVILNLVINAMDAMAGAVSGRREVTCSTSVDAGSAKISIADSGPGIPPDKLKKIFEPFFTTKGDGMGMGLSIARTIVEAHGGRIWAENQTAGGAVFHVSLPLAKAN
jgi:signal transduction histidine kinase